MRWLERLRRDLPGLEVDVLQVRADWVGDGGGKPMGSRESLEPLLVSHKDFGDGLHWWDMAFAAGYPDWLVRSSFPPDADKDDDDRWVWTGRAFMPVPKDIYRVWLQAHSRPISLERLNELFRPHVGHGESLTQLVRMVLKVGLFIVWPWGYRGLDDAPEAIAVVANPVRKGGSHPPNPLPGVIPDEEWGGVIRMDHMVEIWRDARERDALPGGLYDTMQVLLRSRLAWLVAQPVQGLTA